MRNVLCRVAVMRGLGLVVRGAVVKDRYRNELKSDNSKDEPKRRCSSSIIMRATMGSLYRCLYCAHGSEAYPGSKLKRAVIDSTNRASFR